MRPYMVAMLFPSSDVFRMSALMSLLFCNVENSQDSEKPLTASVTFKLLHVNN